MSLRTRLGLGGKASATAFTPRANIPRSDVQGAVEYVMDNAENVGTVYAPNDAQYLTNGAVTGLSNERAVTDTSTITWDFSTLGQAKANWAHLGLQSLSDPGGDRGMFWDDSEGAVKFFTAASGLEFVGTNLSITDPDLTAIINESGFAQGDILYHNGTTLARLPAGTSGQVLRTQGAGADPVWSTATGLGDMLRANNLSDLTSASTARTNLGLAIGSNVQAYDATLQSLSALGTVADRIAYTTGVDTWAEAAITSFGRSLIDDADATTARATLGLVIGTNVQAYDAELAALAGLTSAADRLPYFTGSGTAALATFTTFGRSLVDDADATTARATLGLVIGTDVQAQDAELAAIAGLTSAADRLPYFTGSGTAALATFTSFGRSLVDDADSTSARSTLGLVIGTHVQAYSSVLANTTASFTTAQETKLGHITVTQAVDLDAIETRVNALDAAVVLSGTWDASGGTFPGGGTAQAGQSYIVSVGGTVDSVAFVANDRILAITDNASTTTYASNWHKLDYTDQVLSVAGRTGAVTIAAADITDSTANGRAILTAADYAAMRALLDLEIGTDVQAYDAELAAIAGLTSAADRLPYFTGAGTAALATFTSFGRSLVDDADSTAARSTLGLVIGTDVQAYNARLADVAGLVDPNADRLLFWDDSAGALVYLALGTNLSITGTTLNATGGGGGLSDGDYGDITVGGTGTTMTIDNDVVTFAKMQNVATDRLLGRDTASSGDVEEITVGGGLEFSGTGGIQRSALTGDVTASAGSGSTTIANDAVTYAKMQNASANVVLTRAAGTSGDIGETALTASQLLGRGATGDVAAITLGTNLSMSGTTLNASGGGGGISRGAVIASYMRSDMN